jgi:hypothetical protein
LRETGTLSEGTFDSLAEFPSEDFWVGLEVASSYYISRNEDGKTLGNHIEKGKMFCIIIFRINALRLAPP